MEKYTSETKESVVFLEYRDVALLIAHAEGGRVEFCASQLPFDGVCRDWHGACIAPTPFDGMCLFMGKYGGGSAMVQDLAIDRGYSIADVDVYAVADALQSYAEFEHLGDGVRLCVDTASLPDNWEDLLA